LLRTRILTGLVLAVIVAVAVLGMPTRLASGVFGAFWLIGAWEWGGLADLDGPGRVVYAALFAAIVAAVLGLGVPRAAADAAFWLAALGWLLAFAIVLRYPRPLARWPIAVMGLVVLSAAWLAFYSVHGAGAAGPGLILTGLAIVWSADIGAFFVGRSLGRTPLAPRVSPKKTWEGVAGGVAGAAVAGAVAAPALGLPLVELVGLAIAIALISVVGDLGISMLKRRAGRKDSGVLLPGHGGILDRFDGVTAALPFFALGLQFAHVLD
jgi:phosphatidate cytidylyltransferase